MLLFLTTRGGTSSDGKRTVRRPSRASVITGGTAAYRGRRPHVLIGLMVFAIPAMVMVVSIIIAVVSQHVIVVRPMVPRVRTRGRAHRGRLMREGGAACVEEGGS